MWFSFFVIASAEVFFEPNVKTDEEITTAHLFNLQFCDTGPAVAPRYRNDSPGKPTHDRFERQFDSDIEMGRNERPAAIDHFATVGFKGIGEVGERNMKSKPDEPIRQAVEQEFVKRVIDDSASAHEAGPEHRVPAFIE